MTAASAALSVKETSEDITNKPRDIAFVRGAANAHWYGGDPIKSHVFNALSLTFPEGERFFIEAVKHYRGLATGKLEQDVKDFIAQEAMHTREHAAFNRALDQGRYDVKAIEVYVVERLKVPRARGPMAMLAITAALEHFTAIFADDLLRNPEQVKDCPEDIRRLWLWHAMEETEHKGVAFDVLQRAIAGWPAWRRYLLRFNVMIITTIMFNMRIVKIALRLLKADGITGWSAWWRVVKFWFGPQGLMARSGRNYWAWYKPGFHPWSHDNRDLLARWRPFFAQSAQAAAE